MHFECDGVCVYAGTPCGDEPIPQADAGLPDATTDAEDAGIDEEPPPPSDRICVGDEVHEMNPLTEAYICRTVYGPLSEWQMYPSMWR